MLSLVDVGVTLGGTALFQNLNFSLHQGQRVGLVGPNGAGKSTLLKLISGVIDADSGDVSRLPGMSIGYLAQEVPLATDETPWAMAESVFHEQKSLHLDIEKLSERLSATEPREQEPILERLERLQSRWEHQGGFDYEVEIGSVLSGLGFRRDQFEQPMSSLSGGWRARVHLAKVLLSKPDIFLLDEPTNHLDIQALEWMTEYLLSQSASIIVVSHDRWFLNRICTHIAELSNQGIFQIKGNFESYLGGLDERARQLEIQAKKHSAEVQRLTRFIERFGAKASKAKQAKSKVKQLERLGEVGTVSRERPNHFRLPKSAPVDKVLLELRDVAFKYGSIEIFSDVNLSITRGQKIGLVGVNGAGKSTLMNLLAGKFQPSRGLKSTSARLMTYLYEQHQIDALPTGFTGIEAIQETASSATTQLDIRNALGAFGLGGESGFKSISVLSGGEKARIALIKALMRPVNLILLDEPTNHLDMPSKAILEQSLVDYDGTLVVISHDRRLLNEVCTEIWAVGEGRIERYLGNYEDYIRKRKCAASFHPSSGGTTCSNTSETRQGNQKVRRRAEAEKRKQQQRLLKPLKDEMEQLEAKLLEIETSIETLEAEQLMPGHHEDVQRVVEVARLIASYQAEQELLYESYGKAVESFESLVESLE